MTPREHRIVLNRADDAIPTSPSDLLGDPTHRPSALLAAPSFERIPSEAEAEESGLPPERLEVFHFHSALLPDDRQICVYLPPQYAAEPERQFAVFYLHDGQNLFDPRTSYIPDRTWRAGSTADRLNQEGRTEPLILVGIANTGMRRMAEYTPTRDFRMGGGEGGLYGRLLIEELKPFIDDTYRTLFGPEHTGLGGSSLGGLITLYTGLEHRNVFARLAVLSPSIWWDRRSILSFIEGARPIPELRIWLDIGTAEGTHHVRDTELLCGMLVQQGWRIGHDLKLLVVPGGLHDEDAWANRFDQVLSFLFPADPKHQT